MSSREHAQALLASLEDALAYADRVGSPTVTAIFTLTDAATAPRHGFRWAPFGPGTPTLYVEEVRGARVRTCTARRQFARLVNVIRKDLNP